MIPYLSKTWAPHCYTLPMTFKLFFPYHFFIWFSISRYYLNQFQILLNIISMVGKVKEGDGS
jgi:hypothetical protein